MIKIIKKAIYCIISIVYIIIRIEKYIILIEKINDFVKKSRASQILTLCNGSTFFFRFDLRRLAQPSTAKRRTAGGIRRPTCQCHRPGQKDFDIREFFLRLERDLQERGS